MSYSPGDPLQMGGAYRRATLKTARRTIHLVAGTFVIGVVWAALAQINDITRGEGSVVPLRRMQTIQSLEGGILSDLMVQEGDIVLEGQPMVRMDETRFRSAFLETQSEIETLQAAVARLEAEVQERPVIVFKGGERPELRADEEMLFAARRTKLTETIASIESEREAILEQIAITEPLAKSRSVSRMDLLELQQKDASLRGKVTEIRNGYVQEAYSDLVQKRARLVSLEQQMIQKRDQLARTEIRSPVAGRVNNIHITTLGGVVQPGEAIMEVTPIDDQLLIATKVHPRDVAFIAPGMPASVKITAYDFSIYGDLRGTVTQISGDTVEEDTPQGKAAFYRVLVTTERSSLLRDGEEFPIRPGMVAQVDIETGKRSVLSYLTRPIMRARLR